MNIGQAAAQTTLLLVLLLYKPISHTLIDILTYPRLVIAMQQRWTHRQHDLAIAIDCSLGRHNHGSRHT